MIKYFDMFSGIGGFRAGLSKIEGMECIGHCEIDKFANKSYNAIFNTEGECFFDDATKLDPKEVHDFDLVCAGFPCQPFSLAGCRKGFDDTRGTLFFDIARLVEAKRPKYLLLENVPGLLNHAQGATFAKILNTLSELRYHVEWQVLDSKNFGVAQSRKRLFAFGYIEPECAGKIFPIRECNDQTLNQLISGSQGQRVYDPNGLSCTLTSGSGGQGGKTGLYFIDLNVGGKITEIARCIISRYNSGVSHRMSEKSGVLELDKPIPLLTPAKENKRQNGKRYRLPDEPMFTITATDRHGILLNGKIRRLMPEECLRLQGYSEDQIQKIIAINSDNQVYKQAGNSVTVNVIHAIGMRIKKMDDELHMKNEGGKSYEN